MTYEIIQEDNHFIILNRRNNYKFILSGHLVDSSIVYICTVSGMKISISLIDFKEFHSLNKMLEDYPEYFL